MASHPRTVRHVEKFTIDGADEWMHYSGTDLADVLNEDTDEGLKLGAVGFTKARRARVRSSSSRMTRCSSSRAVGARSAAKVWTGRPRWAR